MKLDIPQIDPSLWLRLKLEAKHRGLEVSDLLVEALYQFLGLSYKKQILSKESNLDRPAGTSTKEDAKEFELNTEGFGKIDEEMWE